MEQKIKVGLVADGLGRKAMGTAVVLEQITQQYIKKFGDEVEIYLIHREGMCEHELCAQAKTVPVRIFKLPKYAGFFSYTYFFAFGKQKFDIVHFPRPSMHLLFWLLKIMRKTKKIVVTFHGAPESKRIPIYQTPMNYINRWFIILFGKHFIDGVIVDSKSAVEPVAKYYRIRMRKITPILLAKTDMFHALTKEEKERARTRLQEKYNIPFPYILTVGRLDPHKNIHRIIEAFAELKERKTESLHFVIVGGRHEPNYTARVEKMIKDKGLENEVYIASFIEDENLPALYALSEMFAFPSLSEGFGLPLVEAMACETPVITSNISAMPEVSGGAALLINPFDAKDIQHAMEQILKSKETKNSLIEKGRKRAQEFTWEQTARETINLYKNLLVK